nr:radical SAM protein [Lachnospiraceae bacterium]
MMNKSVMKEHFKDRYLSFDDKLESEPALPSSLNIELNNTCNQRCVFCPFHGSGSKLDRRPESMDYEMAKKILEEAFSLGIGRKELGLYMSGEPFLYPHLVEIIDYAKRIGFQYIYLTTNGGIAFPDIYNPSS